jgi:hypothetical protein
VDKDQDRPNPDRRIYGEKHAADKREKNSPRADTAVERTVQEVFKFEEKKTTALGKMTGDKETKKACEKVGVGLGTVGDIAGTIATTREKGGQAGFEEAVDKSATRVLKVLGAMGDRSAKGAAKMIEIVEKNLNIMYREIDPVRASQEPEWY